jgi:2-C-methyl-D-erythritol 4-phosphate cytidylyltransferase / 2-C-methyl-D-erythritol 2,4-cyclodiphosphate synthase
LSVWCILLCGGSGTRMGLQQNKTLAPVHGIPAVCRCARALLACCDGMALVVRAGEEALFADTLAAYGLRADMIVPGGSDRQASVGEGLRALPENCDIVLTHDGARALVTPAIIRRVIDSVKAYGTGVAAMPARDTIKFADAAGWAVSTPDRGRLWAVQTPQGFLRKTLQDAHCRAPLRATDDAALLEALGLPVRLVEGSAGNIKLTTREDIVMAEALLGGGMPCRIGHGYDAHRLEAGRALVLGGETIPHETGLLGHSDADAPLHALIDAMLGAAALGDIGAHFPDTDERYRGISSLTLLARAGGLVREAGYCLGNADITVIAQKPRLAPYIARMRNNIANALGVAPGSISVKATTTENMGFEGRQEGISAHAVALLLPLRTIQEEMLC